MFLCLLALIFWGCREEKGTVELEARSGDVTLYVRAAGCPQPQELLIAVAGGPGLSSHYMTGLERLAGPDLAVVTYDQRGVGRSSAPASYVRNYDLRDYVDDLEAVRKAVGAEQVHLLGHYWGAMVALRYASLYPERVNSIVMYGGAPPTLDWVRHANIQIVERIETLIEDGIIDIEDYATGSEEWWQEVIRAYFSDPSFYFSPLEDGEPPESNYNVALLTWKALGEFDLTAEFAEVKCPVLILFGAGDPAGRPLAAATQDALANAEVEFVVIEDCGHFWQERPEPFYAHVTDFLGLTAPE
jgi:proline iminopeptidase